MIKLTLPAKPFQLSDEVQKELTEKYLSDGSDVWNKPFIRNAVLNIAYGKCCYSECKLVEESKYLEVDHFYPKKHFPQKVVEWGNLLPSCKKCNTEKSDHNPVIEPIINLYIDNPKDHLYIENFRFYGKTEKGKTTIDFVALNDRKHFVDKRYKIGIQIVETLEEINQDIETVDKKRLVKRLKKLLNEGTKENEYSATISSIILQSDDFKNIEMILNKNSLWDTELTELKTELEFCALLKP